MAHVDEWLPLLSSEVTLPVPWAFFRVLGVTAGLVLLRWVIGWVRKEDRTGAHAAVHPGPYAFEVLLAAVAVIMAFQSRRFIPLATVVLAGPLASATAWTLARLGPKAIAAVFLWDMVALAPPAHYVTITYWPGNPLNWGLSAFERMHRIPYKFPVSASQFIDDNDLGPNVLCNWEWEGYVRWACPRVKVFLGGRAQQIYTEQDLATYLTLRNPRAVADWYRHNHVSVAVLSPWDSRGPTGIGLLANPEWVCIYTDMHAVVLADIRSNEPLVQQALQGRLKYRSESVGALSHAMCLAAVGAFGHPDQVLAAAKSANAAWPTPFGYSVVASLASTPSLRPDALAYLEQESPRLSQLVGTPPDRRRILLCQVEIERSLADLYAAAGSQGKAAEVRRRANAADKAVAALNKAWWRN